MATLTGFKGSKFGNWGYGTFATGVTISFNDTSRLEYYHYWFKRLFFFTIPLHPEDAPWFAFSVPSINMGEPNQRYHWTVLPQGMKNSPTICQWYVAQAIAPVRRLHKNSLIYHYMDDILIAAPDDSLVDRVLNDITSALSGFKLVIAQEKIQKVCP